MITFEPMTAIDPEVFDRLYAASEPELEGGSYPWHLLPAMNAAEKKAYIRAQFEKTLSVSTGLGWQVKMDGEVLLICAGAVEGDLIRWTMGLLGTRNGSRSWLYDPSYDPARNAFWASVGVRGWIMAFAGEGKAVHAHVMNKLAGGNLAANVAVEPTNIPGLNNIIVTND